MKNEFNFNGLHEVVLETGVGRTERKLRAGEASVRFDSATKNYNFTLNAEISAIIKERGYDTCTIQSQDYLEDVYLIIGKKFRLNLRYTGKGQNNIMFASKSYIAYLFAALFRLNVLKGDYISIFFKQYGNDILGFLESYKNVVGYNEVCPTPLTKAKKPGVYYERVSIGKNLAKNAQTMIFKLEPISKTYCDERN